MNSFNEHPWKITVVSHAEHWGGHHDLSRYGVGESRGTIADVLSYVEYEPKVLLERFRRIAEDAVRSGSITVAQRTQMIEAFSESLRGYTYFEH